jgi:hypothetical protein
MKKLLIGLLALGNLSSYAAEEFQASNISGDWKCTRSNGVQTIKWTEPFKLDSFAPYFLSWATSSF